MDTLALIKRLVLRGRIRFTEKARHEMAVDALTTDDVVEAIVSADRIDKVIRSSSPKRRARNEKLYIIKGRTFDGTAIYTKGTISRESGEEVFYILISAKSEE